jgi:hypothetical protein
MPALVATRTIDAITEALVADKGARFRALQGEIIPKLKDAFNADEEDGFRSHLGASRIGAECQRAIWYGWRWSAGDKPMGKKWESAKMALARMIRLWNRGHLEEGRFMALMALIGVQIYQYDAEGNQFRVGWFGGHFGGSGDGILVGVPDLPSGTPCLGEFKTHGLKTFTELTASGDGVRAAKPEHYDQMQTYMHGFKLLWALYLAVCKDTDEIYAEIIPYDERHAAGLIYRAQAIVFGYSPPARIRNASPSFFTCKMCSFREVCYHTAEPLRNCRTCQAAVVVEDGRWGCQKRQVVLSKEIQKVGCEQYEKLRTLK